MSSRKLCLWSHLGLSAFILSELWNGGNYLVSLLLEFCGKPGKNHLRALIGFQAPQVTVLAKVKAVLTVVKKAWWQTPGAALSIP